MKNIHGAVGMSAVPLFMGGWSMHAASCVSPCMTLCLCMSPDPQGGFPVWHPAGSPYSLTSWRQTKPAESQHRLCNIVRFCTCKPTQGCGSTYRTRSQGYENTTYQARFSRLWETASLRCPDTWVRKPDCLRLPYTSAMNENIYTLQNVMWNPDHSG